VAPKYILPAGIVYANQGWLAMPDPISGSFTANGQTSVAAEFIGEFAMMIGGTFIASVLLERSPDNGVTWFPCSLDPEGTPAQYTAPCSVDVASRVHPMQYRLRVTAYTSGTVNYVLMQATVVG
jgi:hypothetical protein